VGVRRGTAAPGTLIALLFALASACVSGCAAEIPARRDAEAPPTPQEQASYALVVENDCSTFGLGFIPGGRQLCLGKKEEGFTMLGLGLAELGTGTGVALKHDVMHPGAALPLIAAADLIVLGDTDYIFEAQRARVLPYVPQNSLIEIATAPFNPEALASFDVLAGIAVGVALGLVASELAGEHTFRDTNAGTDPNLFGVTVDKGIGYPIAGALGVGVFAHVAAAEESLFRGMFQSGISRSRGETEGWLWGSLIFGVAHAPNALFMDQSKRASYLEVGVPFITLLGSYLGLVYRWHDYSLLAPVAIHFWYDFLISAIPFFLHPDSSPLSAKIAIPF
jgi:membrane protease YdiL (CAAX protease family)